MLLIPLCDYVAFTFQWCVRNYVAFRWDYPCLAQLQHNIIAIMLRSKNGTVLTYFLLYIPYVSWPENAKRTADYFRCPIWTITGGGLDTAHPFENLFSIFYLNIEPLNWFGLFFPSLTLKQFFVHQTFPSEVMKMKELPISMEETHIILPSPCKDHIRVPVDGVQKAL